MFMVLSRPDAVMGWRALMGPTNPEEAKDQQPYSLRAQFGQSILDNAVHGSSNVEHALKDIDTFFAEELTIESEGEAPPTTEGEAPPTTEEEVPPTAEDEGQPQQKTVD